MDAAYRCRATTSAFFAFLLAIGLIVQVQGPAAAAPFDDDSVASWVTDGSGEVRAITQIGNTVYVGGRFTGIRPSPGATTVSQPYLAAFDATTGDHVSTFAPTLDGDVYSLETSADGSQLLVGGGFSTVNGVAHPALVSLDPTTGAITAGFADGAIGTVFALERDGNTLYVGGNLTRLDDVTVSGFGRVDVTTGDYDNTVAADFTGGSVRAIEVDDTRSRVLVGGFFTAVNGDAGRPHMAAISPVDGSVDASLDPVMVPGEVYDIEATTDKLYVATGGVGGTAMVLDPFDGGLLASHYSDGDIQAIAIVDDITYFGHHGRTFGGQPLEWITALDRATDEIVPDFDPAVSAIDGIGIWALHHGGDDLWAGGSVTSAFPVDGVGFVRYPPDPTAIADVIPPSIPALLSTPTVADTFVELSWNPSADDSGDVYYRVRRDGVIVGTAKTNSFTDESVSPNVTYFYDVIAVDAAQNVSGAGLPVAATTTPPLTELPVMGFGADWSYLDDAAPPPADWNTAAFDDALWPSGPGQLGRGDGDEATLVAQDPGEGLTVYFRHEFVLPNDITVAGARFDYLFDDGIAVYVNGSEVFRDNLPDGPLTYDTYATDFVFATENTVFSTNPDRSAFVAGPNVIAVELHNVSATGDLTFDGALTLFTAAGVGADVTPPTAPTAVTEDLAEADRVDISWTAATDDVGVVAYDIRRDGVRIGSAGSTTFSDTTVAPATTYSYEVEAIDGAGNVGPASDPISITTAAAPDDTTPPSAPSALSELAVSDTTATLGWTAATDDVGVVAYDIRRDGAIVGTSVSAGFVDTGLTAETTYTYDVVARDAAGNTGPASDPISVTTDETPPPAQVLLPLGSTWRYLDTGVYPGAGWTGPTFNDAAWPSGPAELGANDGGEATEVAPQPTVWFRSTFVAPGTDFDSATLRLQADDGAVVYINGTEVARDNVDPGDPDGTISASSYRWLSSETELRSFSLDTATFQGGVNTIAIAVLNGPGSIDMSFDAELSVATDPVGPDVTPPTAPTDLAGTPTDTSIALTWTPATDDVGVASYTIYRDGVVIGTTSSTNYIDGGLTPSTAYAYEVEATDVAGNTGPRNVPAVTVSTEQTPAPTQIVLPLGSSWRYLDTGVYPGAGWADPAFNDAAWPAGPALLGADDGDAVTTIASQPTVWFRSTFIAPGPNVESATLRFRADDGAVVYINGTEVARDNVDPGDPDGTIAASSYRWGPNQTELRSFPLDAAAFQGGINTIAVAVVNGPGSVDLSFDAELEVAANPGGNDVTPPTAPTDLAGTQTDTTVTLGWTPATDDVGVASYTIYRDNVEIGTTTSTNYIDSGLTPDTAYAYDIEATDTTGNIGPRNTPAVIVTTDGVPPVVSEVLALGSTWSYLDTGVYPGADWAGPTFDDAAWLAGPAVLGAANGEDTTIVNQPTVWLRSSFPITGAADVLALDVDMLVDDGAVVYINGTEVARDNVDPGDPDGTIAASSFRWGPAETELRTFSIPTAVLVEGQNTIAVAMVNGAGSSDAGFDLRVRATSPAP